MPIIGYGNIINSAKVVSIVKYGTSPSKKLIEEAKSRQQFVDATCGRKSRSIIITESNHVIISANSPEILAERCGL